MLRYFFLFFFFTLALCAQTINFSGVIVSDNQKNISSKYIGYVEDVFVKEGDFVQKGTALVKIDSKELETSKTNTQLSMQQAQFNLSSLKKELTKTTLDYQRYKKLFEKEMISKSSFEELALKKDTLTNQVNITKREITQLKEELKRIKKEFTYLDLKSIDNALVIAKNINQGELTTQGQLLFTLCDINDLVIYIDVGENQLINFQKNAQVKIAIDSMKINLAGKIEAILPNVDPRVGNFRVKIALDNTNGTLLPGMFATVSVQ